MPPHRLKVAMETVGVGEITYIQRVATLGGVAPAAACDANSKGQQGIVKYQADYMFWKAA